MKRAVEFQDAGNRISFRARHQENISLVDRNACP